ncbi:UDP-glycosyltransferase 91C1-like [Durio zibethinus]|uniref:UDP-glycosyltransferase 91C1-like n=1 Tax=Durio zibethinus TaxID=66656 RepID=A0A6P5ZVB7_DURZI|nr:UDP-glycosyltransferase 91C1-like [Durio zibethinus]
MDSKKQLHIVMFPWLAYGHIMPFLQVSKFLAQKGHHIYYISTPKNISSLPKLPPHLCSNITFIPFPLPQVHGLPPGAESTSELPIHKVPYLKKAYDKLETQLTEFLKRSSQVKWIVHDFAPYWLPSVANQLGINLVFFSILCASSIAYFGPPSELLGGCRQRPEDFTVTPVWMDYPNNLAFKLHEMVSHQECMDSVSDFERAGTLLLSCNILTLRSCFEVESDALRVLSKLHQKPIVPLGLLPPSLPSDEDKGDGNWEALKKWLDSKQAKSVFYVALGSEVSMSQEFMQELAFGIEKSGLSFIWVVRNRPSVEGHLVQDIVPPGFEERVSDRGLVLRGWAPQLRVLAHSSIGGFLTHCGWSSVIEALGFGVPLILFPVGSSDLGLVARLMHGKKMGLEIERNDLDGSFTSDLVAESIKRVMVDPQGSQLRANAYAMKEIFGNVELSNKYLDEFTRSMEEFPPSNDDV